jgi:hypothetical protein
MGWPFVAIAALLVASFVMTIIGSLSPARRSWVISAIRLRYLTFALLFLGLGLWMTIGGLVRWLDWGSLRVGLFALAMGAVYLYARGGIGPTSPSA